MFFNTTQTRAQPQSIRTCTQSSESSDLMERLMSEKRRMNNAWWHDDSEISETQAEFYGIDEDDLLF